MIKLVVPVFLLGLAVFASLPSTRSAARPVPKEQPSSLVATVLASGPPLIDPFGVAISPNGQTVYVYDYTANSVFSIPATGGNPSLLVSGPPLVNSRGMTISPDGGTLYVAGFGNGTIISLPSGGGTPTTLASGSPLVHPNGITVSPDGSTLYITDNFAGAVFSLPVTGGTPTVLASGPPFGTNLAGPGGVILSHDGSTLFVGAGSSGIYSLPATGGTPVLINSNSQLRLPFSIALSSDESRILVEDANSSAVGPGIIYSLPVGGGVPSLVFSGSPLVASGSIVLYGTTLFVTDTGYSDRYNFGPIGEPGRVFKLDLSHLVGCVPAPPGLVSWWPADGNAKDIVASNDGTLEGSVSFGTGVAGQAFSFDGTDSAVETSATSVMNTLPFTVAAWVNPGFRTDGTSPTGFGTVFPNNAISNDNPGNYGNGFGVNVFPGGSELTVEFEDGFRAVPAVSFTAGQWTHVAVVYTSGNYKAYVNGQLVDDFSFGQGTLDGANFIRIGKHNDDAGTYGTRRFFLGLIDEAQVYNRTLTLSEVQGIFNAGNAGNCKPSPPPATTTVSVACDTPVVVDQSSTCTATVTDISSSPSTPTGLVGFTSSSGTGRFSSNSCSLSGTASSASCQVTYTQVSQSGTDTITASYAGDSSHAVSSGHSDVTVTLRTTTTSVSCMPISVPVTQLTTCTVTVTDTSPGDPSQFGFGFPQGYGVFTSSGAGTFSSSTPSPNVCALAGPGTGTQTCSVTYTPSAVGIGTHTINATYSPFALWLPSSGSFNLTVTPLPGHTTSTTVSCDTPVVVNQQSKCTITVTDTSPTEVIPPTGTITIAASGVTIAPNGPCNLTGTGDTATCSVDITPATAGTLTISASYQGDSDHSGSAGSTTVTVTVRTTGTAFHCDPVSVVVGTATTCRVAVTDESSGPVLTPTGTVALTSSGDGAFNESLCALTGAGPSSFCSVTYTPSGTEPRTDTITVSYSGDSSHATSTNTVQVSVRVQSNADFQLTVSPSSATIAPESSKFCHGNDEHGHPLCDDEASFNVTVVGLNGFTGNVTLFVSNSRRLDTDLSTTTIMGSGKASLIVGEAPPGNYTVNVTGLSGMLSHSVTINVTVRPPAKLKCGREDQDCDIDSDAPLSNANFGGHTIHFTVSGDPGTTGAANVTIARSAVPDINKIKVFLNHTELSHSSLTITMDDRNYYVYFTFTFHSNVDVDIDLNPVTTGLGLDPLVFYGLAGLLTAIIASAVLFALRKRQRPNRTQ